MTDPLAELFVSNDPKSLERLAQLKLALRRSHLLEPQTGGTGTIWTGQYGSWESGTYGRGKGLFKP